MPSPNSIYAKKLGDAIRLERNRLKLSQEALAGESDLNLTYMGEIERGEKVASLETLVKIAKGLKISVSNLMLKAGM